MKRKHAGGSVHSSIVKQNSSEKNESIELPATGKRKCSNRSPTPFSASPNSRSNSGRGRNEILIEALHKIVELQRELDAFEEELDANEQRSLQGNEVKDTLDVEERNQEAEALGYAMCAQETLLFLRKEGVSDDSELYKTMQKKLIGDKTDSVLL